MSDGHNLEDCNKCPAGGICPIQEMMMGLKYFEKVLEAENGEASNGIFLQPNVFGLVQRYEILKGVGVEFDLKIEYYNETLWGLPTTVRQIFDAGILSRNLLMLEIRALILQRADQLVKATVDGICTRDGACYKCWIKDECKAKAERR